MSTIEFLSDQVKRLNAWARAEMREMLVKDFGPSASALQVGNLQGSKNSLGGNIFTAEILSPKGEPTGVKMKLWTLSGHDGSYFINDGHGYPNTGLRRILKPWMSKWEVAVIIDALL